MQLINYIDLFAGALINFMFYVIIVKCIFKISINKNKKITILIIILISAIISIINIFNKDVFKLILTIPFVTIGIKYAFNINVTKAFVYSLVATFYMFIGEIIAIGVLSFSFIDYSFLSSNLLGTTIGAEMAIIATIPLLLIKPLSKLIKSIVNMKYTSKVLIVGFLFILLLCVFSYKNTHSVNSNIGFIMNALLVVMFFVIIYFLYIQYTKTRQFSDNYNVLLTYIEQYEIELEKKEKIVHDYKNQLIVINGYVTPTNKLLKNYISEIISEQKVISNSALSKKIYKLPRGLKGLLYYKFAALEKSVKVNIVVNNDLRCFQKISSKTTKDGLKIVGILLDNAIEAAIESSKKIINIEFSLENDEIIMNLSNSCIRSEDTSKIMNSGFSTKGKNRGYGLAIVDEILKSNSQFKLKMDSRENSFEVKFSIKTKE